MGIFKIDNPNLHEMLKDIKVGNIQLPDFQRDWRWDHERIQSLIASVSQSFPIGAIMTLKAGGEDMRFKVRPIEGVDLQLAKGTPETLILDGQQRLTSLFQALMDQKPVQTTNARGNRIERWYYMDMKECVDDKVDESIISVPTGTKTVRKFRGDENLDLSSREKEYEHGMFPLHKVFDYTKWRRGYNNYWNRDSAKTELWDNFEIKVIDVFKAYNVPIIILDKQTPKEAVCNVFERVNTGGEPLTVFELLTATLAADNFQLRDDWETRVERLGEYPVLTDLKNVNFLKVIALLVTNSKARKAISCKNSDILGLGVADYKAWADRVEEGFKEAARFLQEQKIFDAASLPYPAQLVPLTAILVNLGRAAQIREVRENFLARWYWCGVLGELYGTSADLRFANDLSEVTNWVNGKAVEPTTIQEATFQAHRLETLWTKASAVYKGVHALIMRNGCLDFRTGRSIDEQRFFDDSIDIHHIFPKVWCDRNGIKRGVYNSIINKTAIAARTNRQIGGEAPSVYLREIQKEAEGYFPSFRPPGMDKILPSHLICANAAAALRKNDFWGFFSARKEALLKEIEKAMGKPVIRDEGDDSDASS